MELFFMILVLLTIAAVKGAEITRGTRMEKPRQKV